MIEWVVSTMWNVKVALETASLNGYAYVNSLQLHYKKPGTSVMHRDLTKQVGGGGKTAKIVQWMLAAGRVVPTRIQTC
jgi:hypothetical protein